MTGARPSAEEILPNAILRKLSDKEMAEYRRPFAKPGADVAFDWANRHREAAVTIGIRWECVKPWSRSVRRPARRWSCRTTISLVQEDSPDEIGRAIAGWMGALG